VPKTITYKWQSIYIKTRHTYHQQSVTGSVTDIQHDCLRS